jgi:hypothetical protein
MALAAATASAGIAVPLGNEYVAFGPLGAVRDAHLDRHDDQRAQT